jgi:DNA repair protein RadC
METQPAGAGVPKPRFSIGQLVATPSEADIKVTRDLIRAGQLLKIEVLDHVILGRATTERPKDFSSLRELGYFYA